MHTPKINILTNWRRHWQSWMGLFHQRSKPTVVNQCNQTNVHRVQSPQLGQYMGLKLIKSLIGLTHKQWLFWNSDIHYVSKGLTAHQHDKLTTKICVLMKIKHKALLEQHRHFIQINFNKLGWGPTLAHQVWVANMEMAISVAKVARGNFYTQESLRLLFTPHTTPATQTLQIQPPTKVCSTIESLPKIHPIFSTPCSHTHKAQLSATPYAKSCKLHRPSTHTHPCFLPAINLWRRRTPMTKVSRQSFPIFPPSVTPQPYDKIMAHLHCLHNQKKVVPFTGSSLIW